MGKSMTIEQCVARLTAFLAKKPKKLATRSYLATLPKRNPIIVTAADFAVPETRADRDARRYAEWEARGKPPSPSYPPRIRRRPNARERAPDYQTLLSRMILAQAGLCAGCGLPLHSTDDLGDPMRPSFDHVQPRARGGTDEGNRVAMHRFCNGRKADRLPTGCEHIWLAVVNARLSPTTKPRSPGAQNDR